jgi:hypothetical protein
VSAVRASVSEGGGGAGSGEDGGRGCFGVGPGGFGDGARRPSGGGGAVEACLPSCLRSRRSRVGGGGRPEGKLKDAVP